MAGKWHTAPVAHYLIRDGLGWEESEKLSFV